jgi:sortase (surface protein transpeptidase)
MSTRARRGRILTSVGAVLLVAAVLALYVFIRAQHHAPRPPLSAAQDTTTSSAATSSAATSTPSTKTSRHSSSSQPAPPTPKIKGPILPASAPMRLEIPAIGVTSEIHPLGLLPDGTVQTPPLSRNSYAGWYKYSPTPGQLGPSVILGHVDSAKYGPGVFYRLGALRPGATVSVTRADGTIAVFRIERVVEYPKSQFPTSTVYGNTDHAALRLITCGGKFNFSKRSYEDNIVAFAALVSSHHS